MQGCQALQFGAAIRVRSTVKTVCVQDCLGIINTFKCQSIASIMCCIPHSHNPVRLHPTTLLNITNFCRTYTNYFTPRMIVHSSDCLLFTETSLLGSRMVLLSSTVWPLYHLRWVALQKWLLLLASRLLLLLLLLLKGIARLRHVLRRKRLRRTLW
jgi:hypothetical protein